MQYTVAITKSPDRKTYFVKIHGTWDGLLKGAELMKLKMPIDVCEEYTFNV